ncbi:hypothetical protein LSCM1_01354 [Leishmania martiniquensis]|uniref:Uncharacterized protein n=1 Tax=Leishmania martiniquensis TaxID=1580590 RepID=A0A836H6G1_9TRYP|nr:hypothetical protein LSCM1_01354 [Leishmania martiniquensis]
MREQKARINPLGHHAGSAPAGPRSSAPLDPPVGPLLVRVAQSMSSDSAAMSQDSPAHMSSFATSFLGSTGTSLITVPPAPPHHEGPLTLCRSSGLPSIWSPQQISRVFQCLPLTRVDSLAEMEMVSRGSYAKNEEEARVEELLVRPVSLTADLTGLAAPSSPREMKGSAAAGKTEKPEPKSINIGHLGVGDNASVVQQSTSSQAVMDRTTSTTGVTTETLCCCPKPLLASLSKSLKLQGAAPRSTTLERSAATSSSRGVETLGATEMHVPLALARGGPSTSSLPTLQRTSTSTSRQSTADTIYVTSPPNPRLPLHAQPPQPFCVSSCSLDASAIPVQSSRAALGAKQLPPLMTFPVFDPTVRTSTGDTSTRKLRQASGAPQVLYGEPADNSASSPGTVHNETGSSRQLSPSVSNPRSSGAAVAESSAVPSLLQTSRLGFSGLLPPLASQNTSVALLSAKEEVRPSPSASHAPSNARPSQRSVPLSTPRPAFITRAHSAALSTSASPYSPISLTPTPPLTFTPAAQLFPSGAARALRGRQQGVRSPLEAIWLRNEGLPAPFEGNISAEGGNEVDTPTFNPACSPSAVTARHAGVLIGSQSQRHSQLNVHELSSSIPSHEVSTMSGADAVAPGNAVPPTGSQPVGERDRRSVMQRIFREPKKGGQRTWVSIAAPESLSSSANTSEKS